MNIYVVRNTTAFNETLALSKLWPIRNHVYFKHATLMTAVLQENADNADHSHQQNPPENGLMSKVGSCATFIEVLVVVPPFLKQSLFTQ